MCARKRAQTQADRDVARYGDLYLARKVRFDLLIIHEYPLEEVIRTFTDLQRGKVGRVLIEMTEDHN
jgi:Zn-dependent alcohol dehydrogenase